MLDRTQQPQFQKTLSYPLLKPQVVTLPGGQPIYFIEGGSQDVVKIECVFNAGKWYEPHAGVSYFTANLLNKGTTTKTSLEITSILDNLGTHLEISPGYDFTSLSLYGLRRTIPEALQLLTDLMLNPTFPDFELTQLKNIYVQNLKINLEKTSYLASRGLRTALFGEQHPYGKDADTEQIEALQTASLQTFHKAHIGTCVIFVSGKFDDSLANTIREQLSALPSTVVTEPVHTQLAAPAKQTTIPKDSSVQSSIRIGQFVVSRNHPDYPALLLLNHILGGYFGSRLMKNIREEKGLTYGIHSSLYSLRHSSYLSIGADVNKTNTTITLEEIVKEIALLQEKRIPEAELITARNHFIGSLQSELSTPFAHADKIKTSVLFSLSDSYFQELIHAIDSLNATQLQAAAQRLFKMDELVTVVAG